MAEDQNKRTLEIDDLKKRNDKLRDIIDQMQRQGRGLAQVWAGTVEGEYAEGDLEATESEYEYEEGEDEGSEGSMTRIPRRMFHPEPPRPFGPVPPPPAMNGMAAANASTKNIVKAHQSHNFVFTIPTYLSQFLVVGLRVY
ncbi:hypothetical protein DID88_000546 [Monilinia fructigena]|uniref:Uncharacterized protein n=1 Tax=Monilinia fructigena TaxID=38457 RepID=A0A395II62_9HELO|nr:hypothetical protein DID88_000546 [Monilinia fructigena]